RSRARAAQDRCRADAGVTNRQEANHPEGTMHQDYKKMTDFLVGIGVEAITHTQKSYLAHLIGLYRYLGAQGFSDEVARSGMFHSIYGTEKFRGFTLLGSDALVVCHPHWANHILVSRYQSYNKGLGYGQMRLLLGNGVITLDSDRWKRQRRI